MITDICAITSLRDSTGKKKKRKQEGITGWDQFFPLLKVKTWSNHNEWLAGLLALDSHMLCPFPGIFDSMFPLADSIQSLLCPHPITYLAIFPSLKTKSHNRKPFLFRPFWILILQVSNLLTITLSTNLPVINVLIQVKTENEEKNKVERQILQHVIRKLSSD